MAVRALGWRPVINTNLPAVRDQLLRVTLSAAHLRVCSIQGIRGFVVVERASVPFADRVARGAFLIGAGRLELSSVDVLVTLRTARWRMKEIRNRFSLCE